MPIKSKNIGKDTFNFQVPVNATTANTKIANFKNAAGTVVASVDIEGDLAANSVSLVGEASIGGGTAIKKVFVHTTAATDIAAVDGGTVRSTEFTVAGVAVGDCAVLMTPANVAGPAIAGLIPQVECIAGKIKLHLFNPSAAPIDPASQTYSFLVFDMT